jgi:hypothetical protein
MPIFYVGFAHLCSNAFSGEISYYNLAYCETIAKFVKNLTLRFHREESEHFKSLAFPRHRKTCKPLIKVNQDVKINMLDNFKD